MQEETTSAMKHCKERTYGTCILDYAKEYPSRNYFVLPIHEKQLLSQSAHSICPGLAFKLTKVPTT